VTLFSGTNDVVSWRFDPDEVARDMEHMQRALIAAGATVLGFTLPDLSTVLPLARPLASRVRALNDGLRQASESSGAILLDFARHAVGSDPRIWSADRLHANADGHARIAAALAWALGLPGTDDTWSQPLPPAPKSTWRNSVRAQARWAVEYFLPWAWRKVRRRSSGDGRVCKRPLLLPVKPGVDSADGFV
jgi:hypothetical protein